jgi:hypothetical protein
MAYHIFVSHAWKYDDAYMTAISWLDDSNISYSNYSVPEHDPIDANNTAKLKKALTAQISPANIVIIIAGMYATYSQWMDYEIDEAVRLGKTIIGIKPWGQERIPKKIQDNATELVGWNSASLISAIKKH